MKLEDVCIKGTSNIRQKDVNESGRYPVYGAAGPVGFMNSFQYDEPYVGVVKDGAGIGRATYLPSNSSIIGTIQALIPKNNVLPKYLYYAVSSMHLEKYYSGATIPHIYFKNYKHERFVLVSKKEQEQIIWRFSLLEKMISNKQQQLLKLNELIKARFVEMFGNTKFEMPVSRYIKSLTAGKSLVGKEKCMNKVLNTSAVSYNTFVNDYKYLPLDYIPDKNNKINTGNVLISRMNTRELVGAAAYVWDAPKNTYIPDRLWKANLKENVNPIFVWQILIHPLFKIQIQQVSSGTSGSMKNISKSNFLKLKVPNIDEKSQNEFANFVYQVDKSKVAVQKSLDETQKLFDSLMQEYFG